MSSGQEAIPTAGENTLTCFEVTLGGINFKLQLPVEVNKDGNNCISYDDIVGALNKADEDGNSIFDKISQEIFDPTAKGILITQVLRQLQDNGMAVNTEK